AGKALHRAWKLADTDADALALQSIVAVARNEKEKALSTARRAATTNPKSATAQIALSYAQQAAFDLPGARASLEKAVELDPKDALAWARLAEVRSGQGELSKALDAAKKAVELQPDLARTQSVLGFTYLTQVRTAEARAALHKEGARAASPPP